MFWLISWFFTGLIVGALARLLTPGPQPMGWLATSLLGIAGAFLGGVISWAIWGAADDPLSAHAWPGYLLATLGAIAALAISRTASRRQALS